MDSEFKNWTSIYDEYGSILLQKDEWFRFNNRPFDEDVNINNIFEPKNANNFIRLMLFHENLVGLIPKVKFPQNRELHTVSAYLFGIMLKNKLNLSMKGIPRVINDYRNNFNYFWSLICLAHDLTFQIENSSDEYLGKCLTVEDFCKTFNIENSMIANSKFGELFKKYYKYCIIERKKIDHGITCGLVIYDQLMKQYYRNKEIANASVTNNGNSWKFSNDFKKHALKIAETIARHNLWVAKPDDENLYINYDLHELIPNDKKFEKVSYSEKDSLLFLLGLVDTLEPIKCFSRTSNINPYSIIKNIYVKCNSRNKTLSIKSDLKVQERIYSDWKDMGSWLDLHIKIYDNKVDISFEYERQDEKEIAA